MRRIHHAAMAHISVSAEALRRVCDPTSLPFHTTADLAPMARRLGQDRACRAIELGLEMQGEAYHIFAMGEPRAGKRHGALAIVEPFASKRPAARDLCYVNRFDRPREPALLHLPAGRGRVLHAALERLVEDLRVAVPSVLDGEALRERTEAIEAEFKALDEHDLEAIRVAAEARHVAVVGRPHGFTLAPLREGELLSEERFTELPEDEQAIFAEGALETSKAMRAFVAESARRDREARRRIKAAAHELVAAVVAQHVSEIRELFRDLPAVLMHLDALERHVVDNAGDWIPGASQPNPMMQLPDGADGRDPLVRRYGVHVLVDRSGETSAPVVYEPHPTYENLVGAMEHVPVFGALVTDLHLIKPGALHRAHGGYLLLEARALLSQPYAWEALKRALMTRKVQIEPLARMLGVLSGAALMPEPLALDVKVVLLGERPLYHLLSEADPDFRGLFRIVADFEDSIPRSAQSEVEFARFIGGLLRDERLLPFDRTAVAAFIEHATRISGRGDELSVNAGDLASLLREACHFAAGADTVSAAHVEAAIDAADDRTGRAYERIQDDIRRGTLLVATEGERVGQINGLTVARMGDVTFGWPSRITARARMGDGRVVDIEKEVDLGGPIHSKGVLILSGFLAGRFVPSSALSIRASIVLEQSYGQVEGDSASLAELYALLSAISEQPIRQHLALTGSINQHGDVQPIGGVNEKIEGFFAICRERGLTGDQGVIIPRANLRHLALRKDVITAVREGRFHIHALEHADDGVPLLFGCAAGERDRATHRFPHDTLNRAVEDRLLLFEARRRAAMDEVAHHAVHSGL
jgi:lon-related putative ATP-dependent protease